MDDIDVLARKLDHAGALKALKKSGYDFPDSAQFVGQRLVRRHNDLTATEQIRCDVRVEPLEDDSVDQRCHFGHVFGKHGQHGVAKMWPRQQVEK